MNYTLKSLMLNEDATPSDKGVKCCTADHSPHHTFARANFTHPPAKHACSPAIYARI